MSQRRKHLNIKYNGHTYNRSTQRMLRIVANAGEIRPWDAAVLVWPDSPARKAFYKGKSGSQVISKGYWLAAGSWLSRLHTHGLVDRTTRAASTNTRQEVYYSLTPSGHELLALLDAEKDVLDGREKQMKMEL
jgi:hypothetical protein